VYPQVRDFIAAYSVPPGESAKAGTGNRERGSKGNSQRRG